MASLQKSLATNVAGEFFVDATCIDCATCRWMAPETFNEKNDQSRVHHQPGNPLEVSRALAALVSCPTGSIGVERGKHQTALKEVIHGFPRLIAEDVYHCGFHSEKSFGAASYLIRRPEGNILVDSPRFAKPLVDNLEKLGGIKTLFLTHRDDIADHEAFAEHFGCERIMHEADAGSLKNKIKTISGVEPVVLDDECLMLPVPGHTAGSVCLLYRQEFLFSGDHVAWSSHRQRIYAFKDACWYDWKKLVASMERLAHYEFSWILPGHGWPCHFSKAQMKTEMQKCLAAIHESVNDW